MKSHTIRLAVATAIGVIVMLLLLMMAIKYAQQDWSRKNQRARAASRPVQAEATAPASAPLQAWEYPLYPSATDRALARLHHLPGELNPWLILGRAQVDTVHWKETLVALHLALATDGETPTIRNDLGALYLQINHLRRAKDQFWAVEQIEPGFAPALFNRALCEITRRQPDRAVRLLGQYLGRRPEDSAALRLQATLLTQLGYPEDALHMLESYLKFQPATNPLFLEAATLSAQTGYKGNAIRYLETAMQGNPIQTVITTWHSPAFRDIRLSGEDDALVARMAAQARAAYSIPVSPKKIRPLRSTAPKAIVH